MQAFLLTVGGFKPFLLSRRAYLQPGSTYSVFLVPRTPPARPDILLGPTPSCGRSFAVFNGHALHDALRVAVERHRAHPAHEASFHPMAVALLDDLRRHCPELAPPTVFDDNVEQVEALFPCDASGQFGLVQQKHEKKKEEEKIQKGGVATVKRVRAAGGKDHHADQARLAVLMVTASRKSTLSQAFRGTQMDESGEKRYGVIGHIATNGLEIHIGFTKKMTAEEKGAAKRRSAKSLDASLFGSAQTVAASSQFVDAAAGAAHFHHSGTVGVDPGMSGLAFSSCASADESFLWNKALTVGPDGTATDATEIVSKEKKARFEAELGLGRIQHERRQQMMERKIRKLRARRAAADGVSEEIFASKESWGQSVGEAVVVKFDDFCRHFVLRCGLYQDIIYARQSLANQSALYRLAHQTCQTAEAIVGKMGEAAEEDLLFQGGGICISKAGWRPRKVAPPPPIALQDVAGQGSDEGAELMGLGGDGDVAERGAAAMEPEAVAAAAAVAAAVALFSDAPVDTAGSNEVGVRQEESREPPLKMAKTAERATKKKALLVDEDGGAASGKVSAARTISVPHPSVTDDKRLVYVGHLAVGNWSGIQPPGYRGNNSFPRKALMRLVVKELRRRAKQQRWRYSGVIVVPHLVSEFRTSKQAPCLCHRVTGEKIDRHNATAEEVGAEKLQDGKATSWKLLTCPRCNIVANRDRSAASAIAANHERRMLAKRFNCTAPAHAGYARGPDSNILHQDAG